jgi:3-methylcrotonyl-CoA carboxylase alpha subunit
VILRTRVADRDATIAVTPRHAHFEVRVDGRERRVEVSGSGALRSLRIDGRVIDLAVWKTPLGETRRGESSWEVAIGGRVYAVGLADPLRGGRAKAVAVHAGGPVEVRAVMPGKVVAVLAGTGTEVEAGAGLVVVEAMKMANEITAPRKGTVKTVAVSPGDAVETGALLVVIA